MSNFTIRTIDQIFQELLLEKQTLSSLNGLVSGGITDENSLITALENGKVAEWILHLYNYAVATNLTDVASLSAITEIENIIASEKIPTASWYIMKAKEFQYDDVLIIDPVTYNVSYATIDTTKQIISSCTILEGSNKLVLKVRRKDTDILSNDERTAFESYLLKIKCAGTQTLVQNFAADLLTLNMNIVYNGIYTLTVIQSAVETAINSYISNIEFDSKFNTNKLVDNLQDIAGVVDPQFDSASAIDELGNVTAFVHEYLSYAGYMAINPSYPLSVTITYQAK